MKFMHIAPTQYVRTLGLDGNDKLVLAHLVESSPEYLKQYNPDYSENNPVDSLTRMSTSGPKQNGRILDNSAYELYRAGLPMFDGNKLVDLASKAMVEYIVMPDYPGEHPDKTVASAEEFGPIFHQARFKTFFVPQGRKGNLDDYFKAFSWAAQSPLVDYIGVSIIGAPNAFNVDASNNIQTFMSRIHLTAMLLERGLVQLAKYNKKKIHFLGMTDGPNEIIYASGLGSRIIDSWDSSAAVWAGIEGVEFDNTPTGLRDGKVTSHVNFDVAYDRTDIDTMKRIQKNIKYIDTLVSVYNQRGSDNGSV